MSVNTVVKDFYNENAAVEWDRLDLPLCRIEFSSTLRLIEKYFPAQGRVCDIGSGPGRYAIELLRRGYEVTLFDISDEEIRLAQKRVSEAGCSAAQLIVGEAQDMSCFAADSFDGALVLGPLYHLIEPEKRALVLREVARVLRPHGTAIVAYLNSWGLIKTGIVDFPDQYSDLETLRSMLSERVFPGRSLRNFPECYWSTPAVALAEVKNAGFEVIGHAGAESFANGMGSLLTRLAAERPDAYENVVAVAAETCELEQYRDSTDHLHLVVRKR